MEILKNFGFDPVMLAAQIVNFLIILYILKRFLYKPVLDMLKKREDTIKTGLKQAEESRLLLEKTVEEEKKVLTKAQEEAKKLIEDAKNQALEAAKEVEEETRASTERMIVEARNQISQETKEAEKRLAESASGLAEQILSTSLKEMFPEKDQKTIVDNALKRIKK